MTTSATQPLDSQAQTKASPLSVARAPVAAAGAGAANVVEALRDRAREFPRAVATKRRVDGHWQTMTWEEYAQAVREIARGLKSLGVGPGDRVGLVGTTRLEWVIADMGILAAGAVVVPVYPSSTPHDTSYILHHAGIRACIVESPAFFDKMGTGSHEPLPAAIPYVVMEGGASGQDRMTLTALRQRGADGDGDPLESTSREIRPEAMATIVYTSGTTGQPKGAVLTHGNLMAECTGLSEVTELGPSDETLAFLPLAHIFARMLHMGAIVMGYSTAFAESMEKVIDNLKEIRPTFVAAVPRVFEKIYARVHSQVAAASPVRRRLAHWALSVGDRTARSRREWGAAPAWLATQHVVADRLVLRKVRAIFGDRLRFFVSGGAPLSTDIARFFDSLGIEILEGYGLTETTAATHINRRGRTRIGKVGLPIRGVDVKIAPDGEILVAGPVIMREYFKDDVATGAALDQGWFHTGDIGQVDQDGYLAITDRKKDIIITAAGKNIAPQKIENLLKTITLLSQAMVYGDRKKYLVALLTLNEAEVRARLTREGIDLAPGTALSTHPRARALVDEALASINAQLASYETIKKYVLLDTDLSMESAELTPTLKLRRREVIKRHGHLLDDLYSKDTDEGR